MTKNNFFKTLALSAVLFLGTAIQAQMKVGANPTTINANSVLEMESTNKGMLLPRLGLSSTTSFAPLAAHVAGMVVYNTATAGDVTPGYFYNDGSKWVRLVGGAGTGAGSTTAGPLITITNGAGATMTAMTVATDTTALKSFISSAIQNGAITGKNTTAGSLITVTNGAGATLTAMTVEVDTNALKTLLNNAGYDNTVDHWMNNGTATYTTTGNVGIGTTTPANLLSISSNGTSAPLTITNTSGYNNQIRFTSPAMGNVFMGSGAFDGVDNHFGYGTLGAFPINYYTNGIERMRITETGNVGIGNTAPTNKLHVTATADPLRLEGLQAGAAADEILSTDATGVVRKLSGAALATAVNEPWFNVATGTGATANTQNIYQMGKVGIVKNNPLSYLHIGGVDTNARIRFDGEYNFERSSFGNRGNGNVDLEMINHVNSSQSYGVRISANVDLYSSLGTYGLDFGLADKVNNYDSLKFSSKMFISAFNGNVGIGTVVPSTRLHVVHLDSNNIKIANFETPNLKDNTYSYLTIGKSNAFLKNNWELGYRHYKDNNDTNCFDMGPRGSWSANGIRNMANGNIGLGFGGSNYPTNRLHVKATTNPLRLEGLQVSSTDDVTLTVDATGVVKLKATPTVTTISSSVSVGAGVATSFPGTTILTFTITSPGIYSLEAKDICFTNGSAACNNDASLIFQINTIGTIQRTTISSIAPNYKFYTGFSHTAYFTAGTYDVTVVNWNATGCSPTIQANLPSMKLLKH